MKNSTNNFTSVDRLLVDSNLYRFVETSVLPATPMDSPEFWQAVSALLDVVTHNNNDNNAGCESKTWNPSSTVVRPISTVVSKGKPAAIANQHHGRSRDLHEDTFSSAERSQLISNCKEYLDDCFPLNKGSHTEAVSYMAYYQNLLVILADGRTTGLRYPQQFILKEGRSESPDTILLANNRTQARVTLNCKSAGDAKSASDVDNMQIEEVRVTVLDFATDSTGQKLTAYKAWQDCVSKKRNHSGLHNNTFRAIASSEAHSRCELLLDSKEVPVPDSVIDLIIAAVINTVCSGGCSEMDYYIYDSNQVLSDNFIKQLQQLLARLQPVSSADQSPAKLNVYVARQSDPLTNNTSFSDNRVAVAL